MIPRGFLEFHRFSQESDGLRCLHEMGGGQGAIKAEMVFDVIPQVWHVYMPGKSWGDYNVCIYIAHTHTHIYIYDIYIYTNTCAFIIVI